MDITRRPQHISPVPGKLDWKIIARGSDTGGAMAIIEQTLDPKELITPHTHTNDVWVLVLSGTVGARVGDDIGEASEGEWLLKPRDIPHAMWNPGTVPARISEIVTPAGTEVWFEEMAAMGPEDAEPFLASCRKHGIAWRPDLPWAQELRDRYGLT